MNVVEAVAALLALLNTATNAMVNAQQISALIQKATAEGRNTFTPDEWAVIQQTDTNSRDALIKAITEALKK